jgi:hypothetical protein
MDRLSDYLALAVAVHGVAVVVVNLTPTPRDDEALDAYTRLAVKAYRAVEILAGVISPLVKR